MFILLVVTRSRGRLNVYSDINDYVMSFLVYTLEVAIIVVSNDKKGKEKLMSFSNHWLSTENK